MNDKRVLEDPGFLDWNMFDERLRTDVDRVSRNNAEYEGIPEEQIQLSAYRAHFPSSIIDNEYAIQLLKADENIGTKLLFDAGTGSVLLATSIVDPASNDEAQRRGKNLFDLLKKEGFYTGEAVSINITKSGLVVPEMGTLTHGLDLKLVKAGEVSRNDNGNYYHISGGN